MREIRQSGSEGGGGGASPYPYRRDTVPQPMAGTSPAMTVCFCKALCVLLAPLRHLRMRGEPALRRAPSCA